MPKIKQDQYRDRTVMYFPIFKAAAADGLGEVIDVAGFRHVVLAVSAATTPTLDLTIKASAGKQLLGGGVGVDADTYVDRAKPTFTSAASASNHWSTANLRRISDDQQFASGLLQYAGTAEFELYEVNVNLLKYLTGQISGYSAGAVTVWAICSTD